MNEILRLLYSFQLINPTTFQISRITWSHFNCLNWNSHFTPKKCVSLRRFKNLKEIRLVLHYSFIFAARVYSLRKLSTHCSALAGVERASWSFCLTWCHFVAVTYVSEDLLGILHSVDLHRLMRHPATSSQPLQVGPVYCLSTAHPHHEHMSTKLHWRHVYSNLHTDFNSSFNSSFNFNSFISFFFRFLISFCMCL